MGPKLTSALDWWSSQVVAGKRFELSFDNSDATFFRIVSIGEHDQKRLSGFPLGATRWVSNLFWHVDYNEIPVFDNDANSARWLSRTALRDFGNSSVPVAPGFGAFDGATSVGIGALLHAPKPSVAPVTVRDVCPAWRAPLPMTFVGFGNESDQITLQDCNGVAPADAIDRLSVIARLPGSPRPSLPLPWVPDGTAQFDREWVEGVHLLHPRLLGLVQRIGTAFPRKPVTVYSGYRRDRRASSPHVRGRALDISVRGVTSESLYAFCRTLPATGCGYYPNQPFVHVDVRDESRGSASWVDISLPGQPSVYTDVWPIPRDDSESPEVE